MASQKLFLHDHPVSSYCQKVRIALRQKRIPFENQVPPGLGSGQIPKGLGAANPRVEVPALEHGEFKVFDSKVIVQYLEEQFPERPLMPKDPRARAEARAIEEICDTHYEAINWGVSEILWFGRARKELADAMIARAKSQTEEIHTWLTQRLGDRPFFNGDAFGFADICVAPYVNRSASINMGPTPGSPLDKWLQRIREIPSVKETFAEYEQGVKKMSSGPNPFKRGTGARREYRDHRLEWMIKSGGIDVVQRGISENTIRFSWPHAKL